MSDHDEVGYGKPPKEHQFKKDQSGNPNGRPPKSKNIQHLLDQELNRIVVVKEAGREFRLSKREAMVKRHVNAALNGNIKALEHLLKFCTDHGLADPFQITEEDARAVQAAIRRHGSDDGEGEDE